MGNRPRHGGARGYQIRCHQQLSDRGGWLLLERMQAQLGPWAVSHPAQWVATAALKDLHWQQRAREQLRRSSGRLQQLLSTHGLQPTGGTALLQWVRCVHAEPLFIQLVEQGVLVRYFEQPQSLRFGLPANEVEWSRLERALQQSSCLREVA